VTSQCLNALMACIKSPHGRYHFPMPILPLKDPPLKSSTSATPNRLRRGERRRRAKITRSESDARSQSCGPIVGTADDRRTPCVSDR
jgi:hypothetical protein